MGRGVLKLRSCRPASLVVALMVVTGLAAPAAAEHLRPFRGGAVEEVTSAVPVEAGLLVTATGAGQANSLGFVHSDSDCSHSSERHVGGDRRLYCRQRRPARRQLGRCSDVADDAGGHIHLLGREWPVQRCDGVASFTAITSDGIHVALTFEGAIDF
jgi:hypothetical protein